MNLKGGAHDEKHREDHEQVFVTRIISIKLKKFLEVSCERDQTRPETFRESLLKVLVLMESRFLLSVFPLF